MSCVRSRRSVVWEFVEYLYCHHHHLAHSEPLLLGWKLGTNGAGFILCPAVSAAVL